MSTNQLHQEDPPADSEVVPPFKPDPAAVYSITYLAKAFQVNVRTATRWSQRGKILPRGYRIGQVLHINGDALIRHWDRRQRKASGEAA